MMLLRKTGWHDLGGITSLLERGVPPGAMNRFGKTALHNAIQSDNGLPIVEVLLDHRAYPLRVTTKLENIRTAPSGLDAPSIARLGQSAP
jgi:ankyrin repeat protein